MITLRHFLALVGLLTAPVYAQHDASTVELTSRDGVITLPWKEEYALASAVALVPNSSSLNERFRYPLAQQPIVISGLSDGHYQLVLIFPQHQQSIGTVTVSHYSLTSGFVLFSIGAILFALLFITLRRGEAKTSNGASQ